MMIHRSVSLAAVSMGLLVVSCGCGGAKPRNLPKAAVTGTVTLEGESLPDGQVIFIHETGDMTTANFSGDEPYKVDVAIGKNTVLVKSVEVSGGNAEGENRAAQMEIQKSRIPDRYMMSAQSGLTLDVEAGENSYDIDLKAK